MIVLDSFFNDDENSICYTYNNDNVPLSLSEIQVVQRHHALINATPSSVSVGGVPQSGGVVLTGSGVVDGGSSSSSSSSANLPRSRKIEPVLNTR